MKEEQQLGGGDRFDSFWKVADVARYLSMSTSWVGKAARNGVLPSVQMGTARRYDPTAIIEWARSRRAKR